MSRGSSTGPVGRAHQAGVAAGRRRPLLHSICPWPGDPTGSRSASRPRACGSATIGERAGARATRGSSRGTSRRTRARARMRSASTTCGALRRSRAPVHAVPRQRVPQRRRGRDLDGHRLGLPSGFGFPLVVDAADPDSAYVIPLTADVDRVTPGGQACASTRRATPEPPGRPGRRLAAGGCLPHRPAPGLRRRRRLRSALLGATSGDVFGSRTVARRGSRRRRGRPVNSVRVSGSRSQKPRLRM